jgi:hypothetical protein
MKALILIILVAGGLAIAGLTIWLGSRWYGEIEVVQEVSVLNSKEELFVFINHNKAVLGERTIILLAKNLTSTFLFPEHVSDDLLVVHLKNGNVSKYDLKGFGSGGSPFVYQGNIYWMRGSERLNTEPTMWRWNGSKFVALSEAEASLLDYNHIKDIDKATKQEGWNQSSFNLGFRVPEMTVHLQNSEVKVYGESQLQVNGKSARDRVLLVQSGKTNAPEMLIDIVKGYQGISKEEYLKLKEHKAVGEE